MRTVQLTPSVACSHIVLGTTYFGSDLDDAHSFALLDAYVRLGGNCIDTARAYNLYSGPAGADQSERCIGQWLRETGLRDRIVLSTKGGHNLGAGTRPRLDRPTLTADLEKSLALLGTDHVELYWLHRDDPSRPVGELLETLQGFLERGWVRCVGASNWTAGRLREADAYAAAHGLTPFCAGQIQWSLAKTEPARLNDPTLVCMNAEEYGYYTGIRRPVFAFSSQAKGFFSKYLAGAPLNPKLRERYATPENVAAAERVRVVADKYGLNPTAVALHYILDNPLPACAIVGCSTVEQLADSMARTDVVLSVEDLRYLRADCVL